MNTDEQRPPAGTGGLTAGAELAGVVLNELLAGDEFCSLWLTDPYEEGQAEACMRVIPAAHLQTDDGVERFQRELNFWEELDAEHLLHLYQHGEQDGYCFALMEYVRSGSLEDQARAETVGDLAELAVHAADSLCRLHAGPGPHGNLKPTNVFAVPGGGVRFSDFLLPLWLDEFEAGCRALGPRLRHRYRAPEQRADMRDYDQRSDIYSLAMTLLRCLTGRVPEPGADGRKAAWPPALASVMHRCLKPDPADRFADAQELYDALGEDREPTTHFVQLLVDDDLDEPAPENESPDEVGGGALQEILGQAEGCLEQGRLEDAVDMLESIPAEEPRVQELLDRIVQQQEASERLAQEAVRLAEMGHEDAAQETLAEAEGLWQSNSTVSAVKEELALTGGGPADQERGVPRPLLAALENERYAAARPLLETLVGEKPMSEEIRQVVERFKRGRARHAFLDNVRMARRLYLAGEHQEARSHWLEAARWLPRGPHRERLRRIAAAAASGALVLEPEQLGLNGDEPDAAEEPDFELAHGQPRPAGLHKAPIVLAAIALLAAILAVVAVLILT